MEETKIQQVYHAIKNNIEKVILGKEHTIRYIIAALFCDGHVLLEDVPGSGKTTLAKTLAASIQGEFKRIQMTPDLLPSDLTGINYYNMKTAEFQFIPGPVFTNVLIADEINRATPKTQSGLLEAMEEKQVSLEGSRYRLESPFMVIATQNPVDTQGVFPLPEAQIDRFLIKVSMGYPTREETIRILQMHKNPDTLGQITPVVDTATIREIQKEVRTIEVQRDLLEYVASILEQTREHEGVILGVSSRGGLALVHMAQALAAIRGRNYVLPDDIKESIPYVCSHRLILKNSQRIKKNAAMEILEEIVQQTTVPTEEFGE